MPDPYQIFDTSSAPRPGSGAARRAGALRPMLWLLLMVSITVNAVANAGDLNAAVRIGSGLAALACIAALINDHYQRRRG